MDGAEAKKRAEAGRVRRPGRRWINTAGGPALFVAVMGVILVTVLGWALHRGSLTPQWGKTLARELTQGLAVPVSVDAVGLGVNRLVLHGVETGGAVPVEAERVVVGLSWVDVWRPGGGLLEGVRWIEVDGLRAELPPDLWPGRSAGGAEADDAKQALKDAASDEEPRAGAAGRVDLAAWLQRLPAHRELPLRLKDARLVVRLGVDENDGTAAASAGAGEVLEAVVNGVVEWHDGRLALQRLTAAAAGLELTLNGVVFPNPDVYALVVAHDLAEVRGALPDEQAAASPVHVWGRAAGEAWLAGSWRRPHAWGTVRLHDLRIAPAGVSDPGDDEGQETAAPETAVYAVDDAVVHWTYRDSQPLHVRVEAARRAAKLRSEGTVDLRDGALALTVDATDVDVPGDVPPLARWNVAGRADFSGTLTGTARAPELKGAVASDGGRLLGQPFSGLEGHVELTVERFSFHRARVAQGTAVYHLEGVVDFASEVSGEPGHLDVVLRTDRGRAEAVVAALGWNAPVQAGLAGTVRFAGPSGAVGAQGQVALTHGVAFGQPFDRLAGQFRYGDGMFSVADVEGALRGGTVRLDGGGRLAGPWRLAVYADDVPLQAVHAVRDRWPQLSGLIGFDGVVESAADGGPPSAEGRVTGRHLYVGAADFAEAAGRIALREGEVTVEAVRLQRTLGGTYTVTGRIADAARRPSLDLSVEVADESVGDLTALLGWTPPVPVSGSVAASIRLRGTADDPEARVRLDAPAVSVAGRRAALGLTLRLKDGRIEVEQWDRAVSDGPPDGPEHG